MIITYLGIIDFALTEQGIQGVISRDQEAGKVHKKLAGDVEEYQEEVNSNEAKEGIDLGYGSLPFEVIE